MISRSVRQFLKRTVGTVEALDVLLLVHQQAHRSWSAAEVAGTVRMPPTVAAQMLEALGARDLLDVRVGAEVRYRYSPSTDALGLEVRRLAECCRQERHAIVAVLAGSRRSAGNVAAALTPSRRPGRR